MATDTPPDFSPSQIFTYLQTFFPTSSRAGDFPELTLKSAERFPHVLRELACRFNDPPALTFFRDFGSEQGNAEMLRERFEHYGTDKAGHGYHIIYGEILSRLGILKQLNILEIGLGSNDTSLVSNMGESFTSGASLRAFRDVASNSRVHGADIDHSCLFTEERIRTAWVDQMEPTTFPEMMRQFGDDTTFDLVIDDGLHSVAANLNTLVFALNVLNHGGWVVIEDIWTAHDCWDVVYQLVPAQEFNRYLFTFETDKRVFALEKR